MDQLEHRLENFLKEYQFFTNSVDFRIVSSRALEKFKNIQAFQLNEIRNGLYRFSKSRRELLLLGFDLATRILHEVENICIQEYHTDPKATEYIIRSTVNVTKKARGVYRGLLASNPDAFDPAFNQIWLEIQQSLDDDSIKKIKSLKGLSLEAFYTDLVDVVSSLLQNCTMELFELDVLMKKFGAGLDEKEIKLAQGNVNCTHNWLCLMLVLTNLTNADRECALMHTSEKLRIYKKYFDFKYLFYKNLSDDSIDAAVINLVEKFCEENGIEIDYKRSIIL